MMKIFFLYILALCTAICTVSAQSRPADTAPQDKPLAKNSAAEGNSYVVARRNMVEQYIVNYGIFDKKLIQAFLKVPRHEFVTPEARNIAYEDKSVAFAKNMTIPRPYEIALITKLLNLKGDEKILELGTGSGYHTAILSYLCKDIYTVDIQPDIEKAAQERLTRLKYNNVHCRLGEGTLGWPEEAPFDAIVVGFAADSIVPELIKQLKDGGRLVIPIKSASGTQELKLVIKKGDSTEIKNIIPVKFVNMIKLSDKSSEQSADTHQ